MLTLANIVSHDGASASPARVTNCTLWTWLHLRVRVGGQLELSGWDRTSLRLLFSCVIKGHWICQLLALVWFVCAKGGWGVHPCAAYCVRGGVDGMNSCVTEEDQSFPLGGGGSLMWPVKGGFQKAKRGDGPSCPLAAAAFCWSFSSVIPVQFDGLWEFIIQLHLCLLKGGKRGRISTGEKQADKQIKTWF